MWNRFWSVLTLLFILALSGCSSNITMSPSSNASPTLTPTAQVGTPMNNSTATNTVTPTPTDSPITSVTGTPTQNAAVTPTLTCLIGTPPSIVSSGIVSLTGEIFMFRYQAPASGKIYSMTGELQLPNSSDYFQYGVYGDDGAGNPTNLLGSTPVTTFTPASSSDFNIETLSFPSPIPITGGNYYWLAYLGNVSLEGDNSSASQFLETPVTPGPTPMPSGPFSSSLIWPIANQPNFYLSASTCP